jgi:hypothetical protein
MDEKLKNIKNLVNRLSGLLKEIRIGQEDTIKLFLFIIRRLPGVTLVGTDFRDKDCFMQGVINLYSPKEFFILSGRTKRNRTIYFRFMKDNKAIVDGRFYKSNELFRGSWPEALEFILKKIKSSTVFPALSVKKQDRLKEIMGILRDGRDK